MSYEVLRSERYLEHFGVKGMHWGEWNEETRARYLGGNKRSGQIGEDGKPKRRGLTDEQKKTIKKVAIGVGIAAAVAGSAYLSYRYGPSIVNSVSAKLGRKAAKNILGSEQESLDKTPAMIANELGKSYDPNFKLTESTVTATVENINPSHSATNCGACVTTSILHDLGIKDCQAIDTIPKELTGGGKGLEPKMIKEVWKGSDLHELDFVEGSRSEILHETMKNIENQLEPGGACYVKIPGSLTPYRKAVENYKKSPEWVQNDPVTKERYEINKKILDSGNPPGHYVEAFKTEDGKFGFKGGQANNTAIVHYDIDKIIEQWFGGRYSVADIQWTDDIVNGVKKGTIEPNIELVNGLLASLTQK